MAKKKHKMLQFTISGNYATSNKDVIDFGPIVGVVPMCDEENGVGSMHVRRRYAKKWIKDAVDEKGKQRYPDRVDRIKQCFIELVEEVEGEVSFDGKNIKELTVDELQDLATAKDLRFIPVPNGNFSTIDMRIRAYVDYSSKVLNKTIKYQDENFNFHKLPPIILTADTRFEESEKITNEEIIAKEQSVLTTEDDPEKRFTMEELKSIAKSKKIQYPEDAGFLDLYKLLFPKH